MKELRVQDPDPERVEGWETEFIKRIDEEQNWLGETEYGHSVELHLLDGTRKPRSETLERLESRFAEVNLYAFFADAEPEEVNEQDLIMDRRLQKLNRSFESSKYPRDESAYVESFYDIVPEVDLTDCFVRPIVFSGLKLNIDRASDIEDAMRHSDSYDIRHADLVSKSVADNAAEAYDELQEKAAIQLVFQYTDPDSGSSFPGSVTVDGDKTEVELADIAEPDYRVENWVMEQY